ncbi:hypothetical protein [Prosthecobacter sp.]
MSCITSTDTDVLSAAHSIAAALSACGGYAVGQAQAMGRKSPALKRGRMI